MMNSNKGYILEVDVADSENLFNLHKALPFLAERKEIKKCKKLICNTNDKENYVVNTRVLKQASNHGLILKKVHTVIQFNQEEWLKPYIDINTKLRAAVKNDFEKDFSKLMNNAVFGKTIENVTKHRDIKSITTDKSRNQLASESNYHTTKYFPENLMAIEMKKTKVKMNKPVYLDMSILDISKTLMHEFWYEYIKPQYQTNAKLCYMDTDSFIIHIKTEDFYKDIADDVEKWFDTFNYDKDDKGPLPIGKNKNVIGSFNDELGGKIMKEFVGLRAKTWAYLMDDDSKHKKAKGTKKCVIKRELKFKNYRVCQSNNKIVLKSQQRFKTDYVYAEQINKIALSSNDDKRLQTFDKITTYRYGTNAFKLCESEMLSKYK